MDTDKFWKLFWEDSFWTNWLEFRNKKTFIILKNLYIKERPIDKSVFFIEIENQKHLEDELFKLGIKCCVNYKEDIIHVYKRFPFLKNFLVGGSEYWLSSSSLNSFLGKNFIPYKAQMSSLTLNILIDKLCLKEK